MILILVFAIFMLKDKTRKRACIDKEDSTEKSTGPNRGGGRVKIYLHAVTDAQAYLLINTGLLYVSIFFE